MKLRAIGLVLALTACGRKDVEPPAIDACLAKADALADADRGVARALCSELKAHDVPGASVAIAIDGAIALQFASGLRCRGREGDVAIDTRFRIGSITKAITAAAAHAKLGDLDRPLDGGLATLVGATPTMRQLLDHTAGLPDVLPSEAMRGLPHAEQLRILVGTPERAGTWRYANGGYALVGAWLEAETRTRWQELVDDTVLRPLHMQHARASVPPRPGDDVACGHLDGVAYDVATDWDRFAFGVEAAAPAGAILASAEDLVHFAIALSDHPPADAPAWTRTMLAAVRGTKVETGRRSGERYASGIVVETLPSGETLLRHSGQTGDFAAELAWVPERGLAVAILSNNGAPLRATLAAGLQRGGITHHF
ncbi:MAG TPA: serine hydrolase domain-containing protein [Nannocystaceae bacterium]|nr:serine hydrolase domain-containing protein [Nannocystaceae bacterium]